MSESKIIITFNDLSTIVFIIKDNLSESYIMKELDTINKGYQNIRHTQFFISPTLVPLIDKYFNI